MFNARKKTADDVGSKRNHVNSIECNTIHNIRIEYSTLFLTQIS